MDIIVGKYAGFCGGVFNSVHKTEQLLDKYNKIYCLGELVHNRQVVDKLINKGLIVVESIEEVPDNSKVIFRAHGMSKDIYDICKKKNIEVFDLTCPKVLDIHNKVKNLNDYFIILVGKKSHPEIIGTISYCNEESYILEDKVEIEECINKLNNSDKKKCVVVSQTTYSLEKFNEIVSILKRKIDKKIDICNTICAATKIRQEEVNEISSKVDAIIVIGGKHSSNTKKLYDLALNNCSNCYLIESYKELNTDIKKYNKIGIVSGSSTSKESIDEVINFVEA